MKEYYEIIRDLREDRDLSQKEVANILGTTQQVYSRYETGTNEMPIHHVITLCKFYKVSADYILGLNSES
ncbi:MAG: helix-turn-helix transcriptional regulator [Oscillospiraceae bacterium]|nr:helix-turn-helix transcriptional regulator [Oscillospiraceae bacterium]